MSTGHDHDHQRRDDDLAAYALGALAPDEAADFERHLAGCERCRAELRRLEPAVNVLPESVARREPPPGLRGRLMAEVRADAAEAGAAGERQRRGGEGRWTLSGLLSGGDSRLLAPKPLAGALATLLLVAALAGYLVGSGGSAGERPDATVVSGQAPGVVAELVREEGAEGGTLRLENVDPLPAGRVLEAWVQRGGDVAPVRGLFVPDRAGRAITTIADLRGAEAVLVTAEPRGGSPAPTSAPLAAVPVRE